MGKKPLLIAISSPKGGVGKSTITSIIGSVLHYSKGLNIAIIDCDDPQHSIGTLRERDMETVQKNETLKTALFKQYERIRKRLYPVITSNTIDAMKDLKEYLDTYQDDHYDIILFDMPGALKTEGAILTISQMDYIFMPVIADNMVMECSLQFADACETELIRKKNCNLKGIYLFWNMIDVRERKEVYTRWNAVISEMRLNLLKTHLSDLSRFKREMSDTNNIVFRSTLFPPDSRYLSGAGIRELIDEILEKVNIQNDGE